MAGSHHSGRHGAARKDTHNLPNRVTEDTRGSLCSPQRAAALWLHSLHTFPGALHILHSPLTTALSLLPPLREITHPSRGGKSHHRKAGSVASKNKLLMLLLLSE